MQLHWGWYTRSWCIGKGKTSRENCKKRKKIGVQWPSTSPLISITSVALCLSSYAHTHTHAPTVSVSPIIKRPVVRLPHYKVPNWLFGRWIHHTATEWGSEKPLQNQQLHSEKHWVSAGNGLLQGDLALKTGNTCKVAGLHHLCCKH